MENIPEFTQFLMSMGVGGILAAFVIRMLNQNQKEHQEYIKGQVDLERGRANMLVDVVKDNTAQTIKNTTVLDSLHRRLDADYKDRIANEGK